MIDAALSDRPIVAGRSLWRDAWLRLRGNKAAVVSAVYLVLMTLACIVGPNLTGHEFSTIYPDYVRVPPSLSSYPRPDEIKGSIDEALKRAHVDLVSWSERGGRVTVEVGVLRPRYEVDMG